MQARNILHTYYMLTKPGIVRGNLLAAAAGFFLATGQPDHKFDAAVLLAMLGGLGLVIASGCVYNNYLDRGIDAKMARTKKRALVLRTISVRSALIYGTVLGVAGIAILDTWTNLLATLIAAVGFVAYVALYGWAKRRTRYGTLIGSISGAIPPVVGYVAVSNRLDIGALLLFIMLLAWQMPHFYAIALYRLDDYNAAAIPVVPAFKGTAYARKSILAWISVWIVATPLLTIYGYTGILYSVVVGLTGLVWLGYGWRHPAVTIAWSKWMFAMSLLALSVFCIMVSLSNFLP